MAPPLEAGGEHPAPTLRALPGARSRLGKVGREIRDTATSHLIFPFAFDSLVGILACGLGWNASPWIRERFFGLSALGDPAAPLWLAPVFALLLVASGLATGLYERSTFRSPRAPLAPSFFSSFFAVVGAVFLYQILAYQTLGRWVVLVTGASACLGVALPRVLLGTRGMRHPRRTVFVGSEAMAELLRQRLAATDDNVFRLVGVLAPAELVRPGGEEDPLLRSCLEKAADLVVLEDARQGVALDQAGSCLVAGIRVLDLTTFLEVAFGEVPVEALGASWLSSMSAAQAPSLSRIAKRVSDVLLAGVLLLLTLPLWPLLALLIRLTSAGPVIFRQERVGRGGRLFVLFKFRTMRLDAEADGVAVWAQVDDPRVTGVGRWLRRLRLDELPQLWNVLRGEMSFVGPRPERPEFVARLEEEIPGYSLRHLVKPGITGWAQVHFPYGSSVEDSRNKLRYDLYYVKHGGLLLDLRIVLRTFGALTAGAR